MKEEFVSAIRQLTDTIEDLLKYGRDVVTESTEEFVNNKIGKLFGMASAYQKCFQRLDVKTKDELERQIHKYSRHADVREAGEELLDLEHHWDKFLKDVDKSLQGDTNSSVKLGETGPIDIPVVDARTSVKTSLQDYLNGKDNLEEILARNGQVIIVSFGLQEGAQHWLQDTNAPFPMVLNSDRKIYHVFDLQRSVLKVWGVASLVYYAEAMTAGKPLPKPYENVHDDTQQMGGDFILDNAGIVRFLYPSKTNTDRPSVDVIIEQLKKIQSTEKK